MEIYLWSKIFLVIFSSYIIFQLILSLNKPKSLQNYAKLPPSPPKLPVIGHLHLFSGGLPQHVLRGISQKYGPVVHLQLGEIFSVLVSSPQATKQLMKEQDLACADKVDRIGTKVMFYDSNDFAFTPYGPHWRQMRKIFVTELLSAQNLRSFGLIRQDEVSRLVLSLQSSAGQAVDLMENISKMTCSIICRAVFGSVIRDVDVLKGLEKKTMTMATGYELVDLFPSSKLLNLLCWNKYRLWGMHRRVDAILERIVEEHRRKESGGEDGDEGIIDVMLRMQKDDQLQVPITNDAIKGFIFDTFGAGTESSTNTLNWAMAELMRNPAVMEKAQAEVREALKGKSTSVDVSDVQELKYLKLVVKETLRLHPPIPLLLRKCREECKVDGYTIPKKSRVTINVWSMGRDPLYWDEPEIFRPERFDEISREFMGNDFEFIPFGAGRRICPALNFGVANVEIPLAQLLYHFDWKLPHGMDLADMDMTDGVGYTGTRKKALFLVPTPYISSS